MNIQDKTEIQKEERLGQELYNKWGSLMKIIEYNDSHNIIIEFQDEYKVKKKCDYNRQFLKRNIKNPYDKTIYNIGYIGEGKYNGKTHRKIYKIWHGMLQRCYDPYTINEHLTYKDVFVCDKWHNFQNFAKWWEENVYNCNNETMELDKDILVKGSNIYSPDTCIIVPNRINCLFTKSDKARNNTLIGVSWHTRDKIFESHCSVLDKNGEKKIKYLGRFNNELDAFYVYKQFKENYIKQVADEYKNLIPQKLYDALYLYKVEIND